MYYLAHAWTRNRLAAGLAGLIFAFNGLSLNFLMWPSHIATFGSVPWVLWLVPAGWQLGGRTLATGVLVASLQMLAGAPETILFTWLTLLLIAAAEWIGPRARPEYSFTLAFDGACSPALPRARLSFKIPLRFLAIGGLVAMVCAPQLLPFLELLHQYPTTKVPEYPANQDATAELCGSKRSPRYGFSSKPAQLRNNTNYFAAVTRNCFPRTRQAQGK